jgi:hypothetical protein
LGKAVPIRSVGVRCLQVTPVGIFMPKKVVFSVSDDGRTFRTVAEAKPRTGEREAGPVPEVLSGTLEDVRARYVRIQAANIGTIPDWHHAKGAKAWLFVDEVLVNPEE